MAKKNYYPLVSVVTVSYKDDKYLPGLISSIERLEKSNFSIELIIVSILSSGKQIKVKKIPTKHISISHQSGYAEAVNLGISKSSGQYFFLPNPDTLVHKNGLNHLVHYLERHDDVGIVGPKVFSMDDHSKISPFDLPCRYFSQTTGKLLQVTAPELAAITRPEEVYWLCGNGIVIRKTVWEQAKKYDESFFLYWEDADFNMKVRELGYKSVMVPDAKLFHKGSASVGDTDDQVYYAVRNGRYFYDKYSSFSGRFLLHLNSLLVIISKSLQILLGIHEGTRNKALISGIIDFYRGKRGIRAS